MATSEKLLLQQFNDRAKGLIDKFKKRAQDEDYYERVRQSIVALENVASAAFFAAKQLSLHPLDEEHRLKVGLVLSATETARHDIVSFVENLLEISHASENLARTIGVYTATGAMVESW